MPSRNEIYKIDYILLFSVILIVFIGILSIYSSGFDPIEKINNGLYKKQIIWFITGFILMIIMTFVNYKLIGDYSLYIYIAILLLLILTTIFGEPIRNTSAWLNFGFFSIQPSEFMKIGVVAILVKFIEIREREIQHFRELVVPSVLTLIPMVIIAMQPDFGTAMIFIPILFTILYMGGADVYHLLSIIGIAVIALVVPMIITYREWEGISSTNFLLDFFKDIDLIFIVSGIVFVVGITAFVLNFFLIKKYYRKIYIPSFVISLGLLFSVIIQKFLKDYQLFHKLFFHHRQFRKRHQHSLNSNLKL